MQFLLIILNTPQLHCVVAHMGHQRHTAVTRHAELINHPVPETIAPDIVHQLKGFYQIFCLLRLKYACTRHLLCIKHHVYLQNMQIGSIQIMSPHDDTLTVNEEISPIRCHHPQNRLTLVTVNMKFPVFRDVDLCHFKLLECLHFLFNLRQRYLADFFTGDPYACGPQSVHYVIVCNELML